MLCILYLSCFVKKLVPSRQAFGDLFSFLDLSEDEIKTISAQSINRELFDRG